MKKLFLILAVLVQSLFAISQTDTAIVKGQVHSENIKTVKIEWIEDNNVYDIQKTYDGNVDKQGRFEIKVPLSRIAHGRITAGNYSHYISLLPSDNFFADIDEDNIRYVGKGGDKNNFLYYIEKKGYSEAEYYSDYNAGKLSLKDFVDKMAKFRDKRAELLNEYVSKNKASSKIKVEKEPTYFKNIEKSFTNYFLADNQAKYISLLMMYPEMFEYRNNIGHNTAELPEEYKQFRVFRNIINDDLLSSSTYLNTVSNFCVSKISDIYKENKANGRTTTQNIEHIILRDSLKGKTQEYVMAYKLCHSFAADRIDTTVFRMFTKIAKDPLTINTVKKAYGNFTRKNLLVGKPLVKEFAETILEDTLGNDITFGKMMEKYKGKVVYLDFWGIYCGPCVALMPAAKKLKEGLEGKPIEFVYISNDVKYKNYWSKAVKLTHTDKNHYLLKDRFDSKLMQFMEINWVPCFMIFDKEGKLVNYSAPQPNDLAARNILLKLAAEKTSLN